VARNGTTMCLYLSLQDSGTHCGMISLGDGGSTTSTTDRFVDWANPGLFGDGWCVVFSQRSPEVGYACGDASLARTTNGSMGHTAVWESLVVVDAHGASLVIEVPNILGPKFLAIDPTDPDRLYLAWRRSVLVCSY